MKKYFFKPIKFTVILCSCMILNAGCGERASLTGDVDEESCITYEEQGSEKQPDYQDYAGLWSEGGSSHEEILRTGGAEFYAEITNNNELRGWMYVQQQRTERFAEMRDISCSIEDGHCRYAFVDDGFGNSGTLHIQLGRDEIKIEVEDFVLNDENLSGFGISGSYVLIRANKMTQMSELEGLMDGQAQEHETEHRSDLDQYSTDWSEERLNEEIANRKPYLESCSYWNEVLDYMENVREVRDISMFTDPLYNTDTKVYVRAEFEDVPPLILHLAKNEIYARHGYIFQNADLNAYFMGQVWYMPRCTAAAFDDGVFNETERQNLELLRVLDTYKEL